MKITNIDELVKENDIKIFSCGSQRLCHAIQTNLGQASINSYIHENGKRITEFIMTAELSHFLIEWGKNKPNKEIKNE